mgnify:CR=1 FL=1
MASAVNSGGENIILFGVPCEYPMSDGENSLAIVVGLSSKYMGEVLFLDSDSSLAYSFVIRKDGSYVPRWPAPPPSAPARPPAAPRPSPGSSASAPPAGGQLAGLLLCHTKGRQLRGAE